MTWPIKALSSIFFTAALLVGMPSCEQENENEKLISEYAAADSQDMGQNCMSCREHGGSAEGWFSTVYDEQQAKPYKIATVKLFTGPLGTGA